MLLAIDVGNTQTVLGLLDGEQVVEHWRLATDARRTADEFMAVLRGLLADGPGPDQRSGRHRAVLDGALGAARDARDGGAVLRRRAVRSRRARGAHRRARADGQPKEVGTDRIVNALAAKHLYGGPCIVVDFGTATTFDVVSEKGEYVGGAIAPGIGVSLDALGDAGARSCAGSSWSGRDR